MSRSGYLALSAALTAVLTMAIVAAFAMLSTDVAEQPIDVASITVAILQIAAVMLVVTLALIRPRTRRYGWMGVAVAVLMTLFVIVVGVAGVGSGLAMALRPPLGLVGIVAFALFDTGRSSTRVDRLLTVPAALIGIGLSVVIGVTASVTPGAWAALPCTNGCVPYGAGLVGAPWWSTLLQSLFLVAQVTAAVACIVGLAQRLRAARGWQRIVMRTVGWAGIAYAGIGLVLTAPVLIGIDAGVPPYAEPVLVLRRLLLPLAIGAGMVLGVLLQRQAVRTGFHLLRDVQDRDGVQNAVQRVLGDAEARVLAAQDAAPPRAGFLRTRLAAPDGTALGTLEHRAARDEEEEAALEVAVPMASLALDRLRARDGLRTASARERARIERDLHDGVQQHLVAMRMRLALLEAEMAGGTDAARDRLDDLIVDSERALEELRALARGERREHLRRVGLRGALEEVADASGLDVRLAGVTTERLPEPVEEALYFACREALQNSMKHGAGDAPVIVSVQSEGADVLFEVSDIRDTRVPEVPADTPRTIAERVGALGGTAQCFSSASGGRRITGRLPLSPAMREARHAG